jgi:hypothetical protein
MSACMNQDSRNNLSLFDVLFLQKSQNVLRSRKGPQLHMTFFCHELGQKPRVFQVVSPLLREILVQQV